MSPLESNTTPDPRPELVRISTTDGRTRLMALTNAACMDAAVTAAAFPPAAAAVPRACVVPEACTVPGVAPADPEPAHPVSTATATAAISATAYPPGARRAGRRAVRREGISCTMAVAPLATGSEWK